MKKMTEEVRKKIREYIKSKKDISELIKGYSIKGENLSHSFIKDFSRFNDDCSNVNLASAIIGEEGKETNITGCIFDNTNFHRTKFLGRLIANKVKARNANLCKCEIPHVDYNYADLTGSSFCGVITKVDTGVGKGVKFSKAVLEMLIKDWELV